MSQDGAIRVDGLVVRYGDTVALGRVTLHAATGRVTALLGRNGAGKTTLVRTVATLLTPDEGSVAVDGHDTRRAGPHVRRRIGLAGQHAATVDKLTGRENLALVARLYGCSTRQTRDVVERMVAEHDLAAFADRRLEACSGGQRRRIDLAATLVGDPRVLLLDEPTTGLDPQSRRAMWSTIAALGKRGVTILLTTQLLDEAEHLANDVVVLVDGQVRHAGTLEAVRSHAQTTRLSITTERTLRESDVTALADDLDATIIERADRVVDLVGSFDSIVPTRRWRRSLPP